MLEAIVNLYNPPMLLIKRQLEIEFYLFVSHGGMNDRGSTCKFRNARSAFRNLNVDHLSLIPLYETNK